jgi:hypothetical protein
MTDVVKVALIAGGPGIITAITQAFNRMKLNKLSNSIDGRMDQQLDANYKLGHTDGMNKAIDDRMIEDKKKA